MSCQLVNDLLLDECRVHVKHNQPFAFPEDVVRLEGNVCAHAGAELEHVSAELVKVGIRGNAQFPVQQSVMIPQRW